ncbi:DUF6544 family protein [Alteribacter natronophilus]|uniref:DUF6544 family protein n=1 Tax=Alteribacter natronophilus TaxID=2583810 RepID=UPI00110EB48E|nr:DUF6544 family protein [Alteribacter natronophilus]TMW72083.1 hypothetical protein FGB90_07640 [Alteribacter natronophilus]
MVEQILSDIVVIIVVLGILFLGTLLISNWVFLNRFREDVLYMKMEDKADKQKGEGEIPPLMDTYLRKVKAAEEADLTEAFVTYEGYSRQKSGDKLAPVKGEQFFRTDKPGFVWMGFSRVNAIVRMNTIEKMTHSEGTHITRLWSIFPVNRQGGDTVRRRHLIRYAADLLLCPQAFIQNPSVTFRETGDHEVTVNVESGKENAEIVLTFGQDGLPVSARSVRPERTGEEVEWSLTYSDYRETASGVTVPHRLDSTWHAADGELQDFSMQIRTVHYEQSNYKE